MVDRVMQNDSTGSECVRLGVNSYGNSVNPQGQHVANDTINQDVTKSAGNCRTVSSSFGRPFTYLPNPIGAPKNGPPEVKPPQVPARNTIEKPKDPGASLKTFTPQVQPIAPKPRPPVPPKRNECTRLTTVVPAPNQTNLNSDCSGAEKTETVELEIKSHNGPSLLESSINSKIKTLKHVDPPVTKTILEVSDVIENEIISNNINDIDGNDKKEKIKTIVFENQLSGQDSVEPEKIESKILNDSKSPPKALQRTVFDVVGKEKGEKTENKSPVSNKKDVIIKEPEPRKKDPPVEVKKDYGTLDSIIRQNAQQIKQSCSINKNVNSSSSNVSGTGNIFAKSSNLNLNACSPSSEKNGFQLKNGGHVSQNATKSNFDPRKTNGFDKSDSSNSIEAENDSKSDFSDVKKILSKVERVVKNGDKGIPPPPRSEVKSPVGEDENESDDDKSATADIWVRTIESPVRKSVKDLASAIESVENKIISDDKTGDKKIQTTNNKTKKDGDFGVDENRSENIETTSKLTCGVTQSFSSSQLSVPPPPLGPPPVQKTHNHRLVGSESLPCSRPGSRAASRSSSPAFFINDKANREKKLSAAEALGVVAKPCPRIIPSSNTAFVKANLEFRRQSLGNLSDSKFSVGGGRISSGGWSSHVPSSASTDVESAYSSETFDYRRKRLSKRCSSVDSRTLSRCYLNSERHDLTSHHNYGPHVGTDAYRNCHTLSKFGSLRNGGGGLQPDCKYFPKSTVVPSGYYSLDAPSNIPPPPDHRRSSSHGNRSPKSETGPRPRSTCNCGHHLASSCVPSVGKRTFSVEELPPAVNRHCVPTAGMPPDFNNRTNNRSSFGKSQQRVKFALDEKDSGEKMGTYAGKCLPTGGEPESGIMKRPSRKMTSAYDHDLSNHSSTTNGLMDIDLPPPPPPPPYQNVVPLTQESKGSVSSNSILKQPKPLRWNELTLFHQVLKMRLNDFAHLDDIFPQSLVSDEHVMSESLVSRRTTGQ